MYIPASGKVPYKVYPILLKTHTTTVVLEAPAGKTVAQLKADALAALSSGRGSSSPSSLSSVLPEVTSTDDFEICREVKEKGKQPASSSTGSRPTYEVLGAKDVVQKIAQPWEIIYIRFRDDSGKLMPVEVTLPSITAENEDEDAPTPSKGKGKTIPEY